MKQVSKNKFEASATYSKYHKKIIYNKWYN